MLLAHGVQCLVGEAGSHSGGAGFDHLEAPSQDSFGHRLAANGVDGVVYAPLTGDAGYLVATEAAWQGLANVQERSPVCLSEPHGAARAACIVGGEIV